MIRQKTSNTFSEGMNLDSNPLVASQLSLSNALNATFITNDGDDMVLLNDMGNARVQLIKLDTGYVPVGMCTHGGITYIASYNPITNMGLVGSFPSPATTQYSANWGAPQGTTVTLSADRLEYIQQVFPDDTVVRPGDKFDIYVPSDYSNYQLVSHTDNVVILDNSDPTNPVYKIKSPKNKAVTISLCVVDSGGNLHDVSSTLNRFDDSGTLLKRNSDSNILLNNGTPFLPSSLYNGSIVDLYDVTPQSIYNYKISGNLYLSYKLNTLDSYEVSAEFFKGPISNLDSLLGQDYISGLQVTSGNVGIVLDATYHYNSPDGCYDTADDYTGNNTYATLLGDEDDFNPQKVINGLVMDVTGTTIAELTSLPFAPSKEDDTTPTYNELDNLFTSNHKYWYLYNGDSGNLYLNFTPSTIFGNLTNLQRSISVNLDKINSGEINITSWKYFVENSGVTLNYEIESYPYTGMKVTNLCLNFYNLSDPNMKSDTPEYVYQMDERSSYHGVFLKYIAFTKLQKRCVYLVKFTYYLKGVKLGSTLSRELIIDSKILITTSLYNDLYTNSDIKDFNALDEDTRLSLHTFTPTITPSLLLSSDASSYKDTVQLNPTVEYATLTKTVNNTYTINTVLDTTKTSIYPFDISNFVVKHSKLVTDSQENSDYVTYGSLTKWDETLLATTLKNTLTSALTTDGYSVQVTGNLLSAYYATIIDKDITFNNVISLYCPIMSNAEDTYALNRHISLFSYSGTELLFYYIAAVDAVGVSGGRDSHWARYLCIDYTSGSLVVSDLTYDIWGGSPPENEIYYFTDGNHDFSISGLLTHSSFTKPRKNNPFLFFTGDSNTRDVNSIRGNDGASSWRVDDWALSKKNLLFWRNLDGKYILVKNSSGWESPTPQELSAALSNMYAALGEAVTNTYLILSPDTNRYNGAYSRKVVCTLYSTPSYTFTLPSDTSSFNSVVQDNLTLLSRTDLLKYALFVANTDTQTHTLSINIPIDSAEVLQSSISALVTGTSASRVLVDASGNLYYTDASGNKLSNAKLYELYGGKVYEFGTKDSLNRRNKSYIAFEGGTIYPTGEKACSSHLLVHIDPDGDGDTSTKLFLDGNTSYITIYR